MRLIDADQLTDVVNRSYLTQGEKRFFNIKIRHAPTVIEKPQGEWLKSDVPESVLVKCSLCGFDCGAYTHNFCPNCGADMRGIDNGKEETT